jgi:hypothetical protein
LLDSFQFERRGIPAVALITNEFLPGAKTITALHGVPDYPFVIVPHPIGSLDLDGLGQRADLALPQFEKLLIKGV